MGFNADGKYFETKYFEEVFCKYFLRKIVFKIPKYKILFVTQVFKIQNST